MCVCERERERERVVYIVNQLVNFEKELSVKGWNWGRADFNGSSMAFSVGSHTAFEIPLGNVSQCTTGKNEVTLEFHQVCTVKFSWQITFT